MWLYGEQKVVFPVAHTLPSARTNDIKETEVNTPKITWLQIANKKRKMIEYHYTQKTLLLNLDYNKTNCCSGMSCPLLQCFKHRYTVLLEKCLIKKCELNIECADALHWVLCRVVLMCWSVVLDRFSSTLGWFYSWIWNSAVLHSFI